MYFGFFRNWNASHSEGLARFPIAIIFYCCIIFFSLITLNKQVDFDVNDDSTWKCDDNQIWWASNARNKIISFMQSLISLLVDLFMSCRLRRQIFWWKFTAEKIKTIWIFMYVHVTLMQCKFPYANTIVPWLSCIVNNNYFQLKIGSTIEGNWMLV